MCREIDEDFMIYFKFGKQKFEFSISYFKSHISYLELSFCKTASSKSPTLLLVFSLNSDSAAVMRIALTPTLSGKVPPCDNRGYGHESDLHCVLYQ